MEPTLHQVTCPNIKSLRVQATGFHHMHYMEWGNPNAKRTVLCIHGLTRNSRDFDTLACQLANNGYRVICPDITGRGKSPWLPQPKWYGYPLYVSDIFTMLVHLEISTIDLVGTSMGGIIGILMEATAPHVINRLVLNDVGAFIPKASLNRIGTYIGKNELFPDKDTAMKCLKSDMATFGINEEWQWEHLFKHGFTEEKDGGYRYAYDPAIANAFRTASGRLKKMPDINIWRQWNSISCPTLLLRGENSDLLQEETAQKMAKAENVSLHTLANIGHAPMLMEKEQTDLVTNWLVQN